MINRDILIGVALALLLAGAVGGFNYYLKYKERQLDKVAEAVYLYEQGKLKKEEVEKIVKGTSHYAYFLAVSDAPAREVLKAVKTEEMALLIRERYASELYESGKADKSLKEISSIKKEDFNYPSASLVKAFAHAKKGDKKTATSILNEIVSSDYKGTYFWKVAYAFLLKERGDQK